MPISNPNAKDLEKVVYFAPTRKKEGAWKVVSEGRRTDLVRKEAVISESEMKVHEHYDPKFRAEEAFSLESVDNIPVSEGDVLSAQQVARFKAEYGDEIFKVEPAFELAEEIEGLARKAGDVLSLSETEAYPEEKEAFRRARIAGSEA